MDLKVLKASHNPYALLCTQWIKQRVCLSPLFATPVTLSPSSLFDVLLVYVCLFCGVCIVRCLPTSVFPAHLILPLPTERQAIKDTSNKADFHIKHKHGHDRSEDAHNRSTSTYTSLEWIIALFSTTCAECNMQALDFLTQIISIFHYWELTANRLTRVLVWLTWVLFWAKCSLPSANVIHWLKHTARYLPYLRMCLHVCLCWVLSLCCMWLLTTVLLMLMILLIVKTMLYKMWLNVI